MRMQQQSRAVALTQKTRPSKNLRSVAMRGTVVFLLFVFVTISLHGNWLAALIWMSGGGGVWLLYSVIRRYQKRVSMLRDIDAFPEAAFVRYAADLLRAQGYAVHPASWPVDQYVDFLLTRGREQLVCRLQRQRRRIDRETIAEALTGMEMSGSGKAMVLANQSFTRRASLLAQQAGCVLIDREALADLAAQYHQGHRVLTFHHPKEAVGKRIRKQQ